MTTRTFEQTYVLDHLALDLSKIDNQLHPIDKYKYDLTRFGNYINEKYEFSQFEKIFYDINLNYYKPSNKIKIMLIVIYNMF